MLLQYVNYNKAYINIGVFMITAQVDRLSVQFIHIFKPLLKNEFPFLFLLV